MLGRQSNPLKLDQKGRVVVPAALRAREYDADHVARFHVGWVGDSCLWVHTRAQHEEFLESFESVLDDTEQHRKLKTILYGNFAEVKTDTAGRVSIPAHLLEKAGIGREALVIGMKSRAEFWDPQAYRGVEQSEMGQFLSSIENAMARIGERRRRREDSMLGGGPGQE